MSSFENVTENQSMAGSKIILLYCKGKKKPKVTKRTSTHSDARCHSFPLYLDRTVSVSDFICY